MPLDPSIYHIIQPVGETAPQQGRVAEELALAQERQEKIREMRENSMDAAAVNGALQQSVDPTTGQPDLDRFLSNVAKSGRTTAFEKAQKLVDAHRLQAENIAKEHVANMKAKIGLGMQLLGNSSPDTYEAATRPALLGLADDSQTRQMLDSTLPQKYDQEGLRAYAANFDKPFEFYKAQSAALDRSPKTQDEWKQSAVDTLQHATSQQQVDEEYAYIQMQAGKAIADHLRQQIGTQYGPDFTARAASMTPAAEATQKPLTSYQQAVLDAGEKTHADLQNQRADQKAESDRNYQLALRREGREEQAAKAKMAADAAAMSDEALNQAADMYFATGKLPSTGFGTQGASMKTAIMNRAGLRHPGAVLAANSAAYGANKVALDQLMKQDAAVGAFESTGLKNLSMFVDAASKVPDTGSPWLNAPLRSVDRNLIGSTNVAAFDAARRVALTEISRVVNNPNLVGTLSDSARKEVSDLNPENATFNQIKRVANVLRSDMANRRQGIEDQIRDISQRLGGAPPATMPAGSGTTTKEVTQAELAAIAKKRGTTVEQEKARATAAGYVVR
jgi:hypothetical protein